MNEKVATQKLTQPLTKPVVAPSLPKPKSDPLHDVRDVVEAIRHESAQAPGEYLDEIRNLLGAE